MAAAERRFIMGKIAGKLASYLMMGRRSFEAER
jgi:hypothetical protein